MYFKDFSSGAMIENIVRRAKKLAIKRLIDKGNPGICVERPHRVDPPGVQGARGPAQHDQPRRLGQDLGQEGRAHRLRAHAHQEARRRHHRRPLDRAGRHRPVPLGPHLGSRSGSSSDPAQTAGHARRRHPHRLARPARTGRRPTTWPALVAASSEDPARLPLEHDAALRAGHGRLRRRRRRLVAQRGRRSPSPPSAGPTTGSSGCTRFTRAEYWPWPDDSPLRRTDGTPDVVEIGYTWLAASAQRTGINVEAKRLMLGPRLRHLGGAPGVARHRRPQPPVAPGHRGAGRPVRGRDPGRADRRRRHRPRLGPVLDRRRRVARRPRPPRPPPRRLVPPRLTSARPAAVRARTGRALASSRRARARELAGPSGWGSSGPRGRTIAVEGRDELRRTGAVASAPMADPRRRRPAGRWSPRCAR